METYQINEKWSIFFDYLNDQLGSFEKNLVGFMYRSNMILIRTQDEELLDIIGRNYILINCTTVNCLESKNKKWNFFGNSDFFCEKLKKVHLK